MGISSPDILDFVHGKTLQKEFTLDERNTKILIKMLPFSEVTLLIFIITPLINRRVIIYL